MRCRLFLIDIGEDRTQPSVRLWGVDDKDHRVVIILNKLRPYFYFVPDSEISATQSSMSKTFPKTKVTIEDRYRLGRAVRSLKVTCPNIQVMDQCVKSIRKEAKSGELFEDDLRLSVRYMTDFNATPSTWLEFNVEPMKIAGLQADQTYIATEEEPESVPISRPSLRVMGFSMLHDGMSERSQNLQPPSEERR
jgi:DNA polymerase elongation subunit (family B)